MLITLADSAVTPIKRSGGFVIGNFTPSATGNKSITGLGFKPKKVRFVNTAGNSTSAGAMLIGAMDEHGNQYVALTTQSSRYYDTSHCFGYISGASNVLAQAGSYVSMDSDGFTVNITAQNGTPVYYEAES